MSIMFGGFMGIWMPEGLVRALLDHGLRNLTLIGNDRGFPDTRFGPLVVNKRVKKLIAGC
jgi:acetate CoA/acetoacetate CoA-transferase alpha subunit